MHCKILILPAEQTLEIGQAVQGDGPEFDLNVLIGQIIHVVPLRPLNPKKQEAVVWTAGTRDAGHVKPWSQEQSADAETEAALPAHGEQAEDPVAFLKVLTGQAVQFVAFPVNPTCE